MNKRTLKEIVLTLKDGTEYKLDIKKPKLLTLNSRLLFTSLNHNKLEVTYLNKCEVLHKRNNETKEYESIYFDKILIAIDKENFKGDIKLIFNNNDITEAVEEVGLIQMYHMVTTLYSISDKCGDEVAYDISDMFNNLFYAELCTDTATGIITLILEQENLKWGMK